MNILAQLAEAIRNLGLWGVIDEAQLPIDERKTVDRHVVSITAEGVLIGSGQGVEMICFSELNPGHCLISDPEPYQIGVHVGMHIARMMALSE